jgi:hypothetical protein
VADKLEIWNEALILIGERTLASLTEDREPRRVLDTVYTNALQHCLEAGQWNFATHTFSVAADSGSPTLIPGWSYRFTKSEHWLRTIAVSASSTFNPPLNDYADEQSYWWANVTPLYIRMVNNSSNYGRNLLLWPKTFTRYVEAHLALLICERLTQSSTKYDRIEKIEKRRLQDALAKDAMNEPTKYLPQGSWVSSRGHSVRNRDPKIA